jgi:hypothetical protein
MAGLTLFPTLTLESWIDIMQASININAMFGFYFIFFIITGTFIVIIILLQQM